MEIKDDARSVVVLSLFDGMSCAQIALERQGFKVTKYFASEIDKYASKITMKNYPNTVNLGDITLIDVAKLPKIDLIIGGSPCQGFSFAGRQLAFDDPRSKLFFEYVRILREVRKTNPDVKFILENVRMKKEYLDAISEQLGVHPICINSALLSAQNRGRYYWTNIEGVEQPKDRHIYLKDILQDGIENTTLMSDTFIQRQSGRKCLVDEIKDKSVTLASMEYVKNGRQGDYIACDSDGTQVLTETKFHSYNRKTGVGKELNKAYPLNASDHRGLNRNQNQTAVVTCGAMLNRRLDPVTGKRAGKGKDFEIVTRLELRPDQKTGALTTFQKDNLVVLGMHYRKLTPIECERLQTLPDNYSDGVSNTQRYKMIGNGMTVDIISHILSYY